MVAVKSHEQHAADHPRAIVKAIPKAILKVGSQQREVEAMLGGVAIQQTTLRQKSVAKEQEMGQQAVLIQHRASRAAASTTKTSAMAIDDKYLRHDAPVGTQEEG